MIDVALARCHTLPEPDPDEAPLLSALAARGLQAESWAWDDDAVDWSAARLVVLRATWNYYLDRDRFLAWARHVDEVTLLANPIDVISWSTHKRYLLDLADAGVKVIPTALVARGNEVDLAPLCSSRGWQRVVVKPAVAAASYGAYVDGEDGVDQARFAAMVGAGDVLVQRFVDSVESHGERSVVVIDGQLTHSVRKQPRFGDDPERVTGPHPIAPAESELARAALAAVPENRALLYARIDMVRDAADEPMVSELELAEPSLFFDYSDEALARMVNGIENRLQRGRRH